jgi:hypothetical protein
MNRRIDPGLKPSAMVLGCTPADCRRHRPAARSLRFGLVLQFVYVRPGLAEDLRPLGVQLRDLLLDRGDFLGGLGGGSAAVFSPSAPMLATMTRVSALIVSRAISTACELPPVGPGRRLPRAALLGELLLDGDVALLDGPLQVFRHLAAGFTAVRA